MANSPQEVSMDYISLLPKEIVHAHILSKLSIKEAAGTSVLSKWWKSLWSSLPYLEFYHLYNTRGFRDFVDQTLRDRKRAQTNILKFKLRVSRWVQLSDIDNWSGVLLTLVIWSVQENGGSGGKMKGVKCSECEMHFWKSR